LAAAAPPRGGSFREQGRAALNRQPQPAFANYLPG